MFAKRRKLVLLASMLLSAAVVAGASITIYAGFPPYSSCPAIQGTTYQSGISVIEAGMSQAVGQYRVNNGTSTAPIGTTVTVVWQDNSQSKGKVISYSSDAAIEPNTLSSSPPSGGTGGSGGGSGDPGDNGGGTTGGGGSAPGPGGCTGTGCDKKGTVIVGPIQT